MKDLIFLITNKTLWGCYLVFFWDLEHSKDGSFLLLANSRAYLVQMLEKCNLLLLILVIISCKDGRGGGKGVEREIKSKIPKLRLQEIKKIT